MEALESCGADFVERRYLEDWTKSYQVIPSHTKSLPANGGSMGFQFSFENDYSNEGVSDAARCVSQSIHKHILFADDCQNGGK